MVLSVNTNLGAAIALQNLNATNNRLERSQLNITTGLRVNGPKDDAATYAIAQNQRGNIAGYRALRTALAGGESTVNVAIQAGKAISELLIEMKAKVVTSNQSQLDAASRTALHNDFIALRDQIATIVATAQFNGVNLIDAAATNLQVLSTIDGSQINISAQKMDTTTLAVNASTLLTSAGALTALTAVNAAIISVSNQLAQFGSGAKRLDIQADFTTKLVDILTDGVGNLVDADMAQESANLASLQVKQQLGVQALSIANATPQVILRLFQ
jgi:flagellin